MRFVVIGRQRSSITSEEEMETGVNFFSVPLTCLLLGIFSCTFLRKDLLLLHLSFLCHTGLYKKHGLSLPLSLSHSFIPYVSYPPLSGSFKVIVLTSNHFLCIQAPAQPVCISVCVVCIVCPS